MSIDTYDVVTKLIGDIDPVGETHTDNKRLENLKALILLTNKLMGDIDRVYRLNKDFHQASMKEASNTAKAFLDAVCEVDQKEGKE